MTWDTQTLGDDPYRTPGVVHQGSIDTPHIEERIRKDHETHVGGLVTYRAHVEDFHAMSVRLDAKIEYDAPNLDGSIMRFVTLFFSSGAVRVYAGVDVEPGQFRKEAVR